MGAPIRLELAVQPDDEVLATYSLTKPAPSLHFAQELGGYRSQDWRSVQSGFRWTVEGEGERLERKDGRPFDHLTLAIPLRYRHLPKSYAPFSPFSEGSALIHSGQFHACLTTPCSGTEAMPIAITAPGKTVGVDGRRTADHARFVSRDDGTNVFVGTLSPVEEESFVAIVDPGLPSNVRAHLERSLPRAMNDLASIYGPLSFRPELYVSIDARPRDDGNQSTQGGTLPEQIFMHFDGANARDRLASGSPFWLDWFFAHEAAHLFQQDRAGRLAGDEQAAWIHEGGADAMAAITLALRGHEERSYAAERVREAATACSAGLSAMPLGRATAEGQFDLHYQCGLLIWLALDRELRALGKEGLHTFNNTFFARVRAGEPWNKATFLSVARGLGISTGLLERIETLDRGGYADPQAEVAALTASLGFARP